MTIHNERPCNADNYRKGRKQAVKYLVIHYVGAPGNAAANAKYYGSAKGINASAHYFVGHGPSPEVWASVAEADTAWHVGCKTGYKHPDCRNDNSIGVELCCHQNGSGVWYFNPETVDAAVELARDIVTRYNIPKDRVLRHYDVTGKICPAPFVKDKKAWDSFKERVFNPSRNDKEEINMTKEDVQKIVKEEVKKAVAELKPIIYKTVDDIPDWGIDTVDKLVNQGKLRGDQDGNLNLSNDLLRALVIMNR